MSNIFIYILCTHNIIQQKFCTNAKFCFHNQICSEDSERRFGMIEVARLFVSRMYQRVIKTIHGVVDFVALCWSARVATFDSSLDFCVAFDNDKAWSLLCASKYFHILSVFRKCIKPRWKIGTGLNGTLMFSTINLNTKINIIFHARRVVLHKEGWMKVFEEKMRDWLLLTWHHLWQGFAYVTFHSH